MDFIEEKEISNADYLEYTKDLFKRPEMKHHKLRFDIYQGLLSYKEMEVYNPTLANVVLIITGGHDYSYYKIKKDHPYIINAEKDLCNWLTNVFDYDYLSQLNLDNTPISECTYILEKNKNYITIAIYIYDNSYYNTLYNFTKLPDNPTNTILKQAKTLLQYSVFTNMNNHIYRGISSLP